MSKDHGQIDYGVSDDFLDTELEDAYGLDFNDTKAMKKQSRAKKKRNARRRLEDYFERKAFKEREKEWDFNFDY